MTDGRAAARFRRVIRTIATDGKVEAEVADDFHHFGLILHHRDGRVTGVEGTVERYPWTTCLAAPTALAAFKGVEIDPHPLAVFPVVNPRLQCTHLFELAALAMAQAARGAGERLYAVDVGDPIDGIRHASLHRDGALILDLRADTDILIEAGVLSGLPIRSLTGRILAEMSPSDGEMWLVMRQALRTARGRQMPLDDAITPMSLNVTPLCFTGLPENLPRAQRMRASQRDFSTGPGPDASLIFKRRS